MKTVFVFYANEVRDCYEDLGINRHSICEGRYYYTIDREYDVNMSKGDSVYIDGVVCCFFIIVDKTFCLDTNEMEYYLKMN